MPEPPVAVLADQALYEHLVDAILARQLLPGERLSEASLVLAFGVSRTTVRKVLHRLEAEDVLDIRPNCGASVASTPPTVALEYLAARRVLEGELAERASTRAGAADIRRLRAIHARERRALSSGERGSALRYATDLHFAIAQCAGNAPLAEAARRVICRNQLIVAQYAADAPDAGCACADHAAVIDAIAGGDPVVARTTMVDHLDGLARQLVLSLNDSEVPA
ncbi:MAG: GntR family transcriptional regulator [Pseudomonadota bacterium]